MKKGEDNKTFTFSQRRMRQQYFFGAQSKTISADENTGHDNFSI